MIIKLLKSFANGIKVLCKSTNEAADLLSNKMSAFSVDIQAKHFHELLELSARSKDSMKKVVDAQHFDEIYQKSLYSLRNRYSNFKKDLEKAKQSAIKRNDSEMYEEIEDMGESVQKIYTELKEDYIDPHVLWKFINKNNKEKH